MGFSVPRVPCLLECSRHRSLSGSFLTLSSAALHCCNHSSVQTLWAKMQYSSVISFCVEMFKNVFSTKANYKTKKTSSNGGLPQTSRMHVPRHCWASRSQTYLETCQQMPSRWKIRNAEKISSVALNGASAAAHLWGPATAWGLTWSTRINFGCTATTFVTYLTAVLMQFSHASLSPCAWIVMRCVLKGC